jgi:3-oxoadipate enol-lactonase
VFSNSLGTDLDMWDRTGGRVLARDFHVLRYDTRGHGRSQPGRPVHMERNWARRAGLLDHLGIDRAHFCGLSMGGVTGQWLGW